MPDWYLHMEGFGPTHDTTEPNAADNLFAEFVKKVQASGHRLYQARFAGDRPEENFLDHVTMDLHEELVQMAAKAQVEREKEKLKAAQQETEEVNKLAVEEVPAPISEGSNEKKHRPSRHA